MIFTWLVEHGSLMVEPEQDPISLTLADLVYFIFIMLNDSFGDEPAEFKIWSLFLTETRFHVRKCSIKEQYIYWPFLELFHRFQRNVIPIYLLSTKKWLFLFSTKIFRETNSFILYWLKSFISLSTCFLIDMNYLLNLHKLRLLFTISPYRQVTNCRIGCSSYFTQTKLEMC